MKDKMEHTLKNLLENQELPYNSAAWDSMKQALDAKMPVTKPTNWYKWFLGGAAITVIALGTFFFKQKDTPTQPQSASSRKMNQALPSLDKSTASDNQNKTEIINSNDENETQISPSSSFIDNTDKLSNLDRIVQEETQEMGSLSEQDQKSTLGKKQGIIEAEKNENSITSNNQEIQPGNIDSKEELTANSTLISAVNMCLGERQLLENKNDFAVIVYKQNTNQAIATIESKKSLIFEAKEQGTYLFVQKNQLVSESTNSFEVKNSFKPTLDIESEIRYEKGIPTLKATTNASNSVQWTVNNMEMNSSKNELDFNPFKAGNYAVTVRTLTEGCIVSQTSKVNIDEDYNLLAVNAFNPNSFEPRNQTFIPFALTQRDVKFILLILDPKDGGIIYQTDDASQPWNGIDRRTGQLSPSNQAYIWKVRIANPLPGESAEYKGTITKL